MVYHLICVVLLLIAVTTNAQDVVRRRTSNTCRDDNDCPTYAHCEHNSAPTNNGQCVCQEGFIIIAENKSRKCYKVAAHIQDQCIFDEQCMYKFSTEAQCLNGICQCREGTHFVQKENACYKSVNIGGFCRLTNNCVVSDSVCKSGVCTCPLDTHPSEDNSYCIQNVGLGEPCSFDSECIADNSRCHDICRCKVSHVISKNESSCLRIADQMSNDCEEDSQCLVHIAHSVCNSETKNCNCKEGYHEFNYKCWVTVSYAGICEVNENCALIDGAICRADRCECENGNYRFIDGECSSCSIVYYSNVSILALLLLLIYFKNT